MSIQFFLEPSAEIVPEYARFTDRTLWRIWVKREEKHAQKATYSELVLRGTLEFRNAVVQHIEDGSVGQPDMTRTFRDEMSEIVLNKYTIAALCIESGLHREAPQGKELTPLTEGMSDVDLSAALCEYCDWFYAHYAAWKLSDPEVAYVWLDRFLQAFFRHLMLCIRQRLMGWHLGGSALDVETKARWSVIVDTAVFHMQPRNGCREGKELQILPSMIRDSILPEIDDVPLIRLPPHKLLEKWRAAPQPGMDDDNHTAP